MEIVYGTKSEDNNSYYKYICDDFYIPDMGQLVDGMFFNHGLKSMLIGESSVYKAGYGIRLRYLDGKGKIRCAVGYGNIMFFGGADFSLCENVSVELDAQPQISVCGNYVRVRGKILLKNIE